MLSSLSLSLFLVVNILTSLICIERRRSGICFDIVVIEFTFVPCHPGFDVINTRMCGEERSGICFGIVVTEFKFVCRPYFHVVNTRVYEEEDI